MPDHVLMVVWENTDYSSLIGNSAQAPYLNSLLSQGLLFTNYHALDHPSEGNYIAMFSGGDQGLTTDNCPQSTSAENVFHLMAQANKTYLGYMEDLPSVGFTGCTNLNYVRRHNASIQFTNVTAATSVPWTQFPSDYTTLPNLSVVIPNLQHDLHDGTMAQADAWLQANLDPYIQWCKTHNSLFIFTIDESATGIAASQVPLLIIGQGVTANTTNTVSYDHTNLSSTLTDLFGLPSLAPHEITGWYGVRTLCQDTFQRSNVVGGWGTATDGHPWTTETAFGTIAVTSDAGLVTGSNHNGSNFLLGSASRTDTEVLCQFSVSDASAACHPILRYQSPGNYYYAGQDESGVLRIKKRTGDVGSNLVSVGNVLTANQKYWIRFNATGSTLSLRLWQDGNAEPGTWNLQTTDTSYPGGAVGHRSTCFGLSDTVSVYSLAYTDFTLTPQNRLTSDSFVRANQAGLGVSPEGELWVERDSGSGATYSILSNRGKATTFTGGFSSNTIVSGMQGYDLDATFRFSASAPSGNGAFFIARWSGTANFYYIGFVNNNLSVRKFVASAQTTVASSAFTVTANSNYWLHVLVLGTTIKVKAWLDGTAEPTSWTVSTTDSSLTHGNTGLRFFGAVSDVVLVNSLSINDPNVSLSATFSNAGALSGVLTPPLTIRGQDNFTRANQSGLGLASDGINTWAQVIGNTPTTITSHQGKLTGGTNGTNNLYTLGSTQLGDIDIIAHFPASAALDSVGPAGRIKDVNNYYRACYSNGQFFLTKIVGNSGTDLVVVSGVDVPTAGYSIHLQIQGNSVNNIRASYWIDGNSDPGFFAIATDSSITANGNFGFRARVNNNADIIEIDSFLAQDPPAFPTPPVPPVPFPDISLGMTLYVPANNQILLEQQTINDMLGIGLGAGLRYQIKAKTIDVAGNNTYDWTYLDWAVTLCNSYGIRFFLPIEGFPSNYLTISAVDGSTVAAGTGDYASPAQWVTYVTAVCNRYNGTVASPISGYPMTVDFIQIENEDYDSAQPGVANNQPARDHLSQWLVLVANAVYPVIKSIHPNCVVGLNAVRKTPTNGLLHITNWITNLFTYSGGLSSAMLNDPTFFLDFHAYFDGRLAADGVTLVPDPSVSTFDSLGNVNAPSVQLELSTIFSIARSYGFKGDVNCFEMGWLMYNADNDIYATDTSVQSWAQDSIYRKDMYEAVRSGGGKRVYHFTMSPSATVRSKTLPFSATNSTPTVVSESSAPRSITQIISGSLQYTDAYAMSHQYALDYGLWHQTGIVIPAIKRRDGATSTQRRSGNVPSTKRRG